MNGNNGHAATGNGQDPFNDLDGLRLPNEEVAKRPAAAKGRAAQRQPSLRIARQFVRVPLEWAEKLDPVTLKVFMFILHRRFQNHGPDFPAATDGLRHWGISRWQKKRALNKLEQLGLIGLEHQPKKNPTVRRISA